MCQFPVELSLEKRTKLIRLDAKYAICVYPLAIPVELDTAATHSMVYFFIIKTLRVFGVFRQTFGNETDVL